MNNRIKELRIALKMSQEELANKAGVSRVFLTTVENGGATPSVKNALAIANALNKTVNEVFEYIGEESN